VRRADAEARREQLVLAQKRPFHDGNGDRSLSGARTAAFTLAAAAAWQAATEMPLIPG